MSMAHRAWADAYRTAAADTNYTSREIRSKVKEGEEPKEALKPNIVSRAQIKWRTLPGGRGRPVQMSAAHGHVYMALVMHTHLQDLDDDSIQSTASANQLAETCFWSVSQIEAVLSDLKQVGLIQTKRRVKRSNVTIIFRTAGNYADSNEALAEVEDADDEHGGPRKEAAVPSNKYKGDSTAEEISAILTEHVGKPVRFNSVAASLRSEANLVQIVRACLTSPTKAEAWVSKLETADDPAAVLAKHLPDMVQKHHEHADWMEQIERPLKLLAFEGHEYREKMTDSEGEDTTPQERLGEFFVRALEPMRTGLASIRDNKGYNALCQSIEGLMVDQGEREVMRVCTLAFTSREDSWRQLLTQAKEPGAELAIQFRSMQQAFPADAVAVPRNLYKRLGVEPNQPDPGSERDMAPDDSDDPPMGHDDDSDSDDVFDAEMARREAEYEDA